MRTITAVIADDEPLAREKLRMLLQGDPDISLAAECATVRETACAIRAHQPDLLFLDIQMPDGDGFQVIQGFEEGVMPYVIFTTAYDEYAVRAFEAHAFDYLLKPFDARRFERSLQRVKGHLAAAERAKTGTRLMELLGSLAARVSLPTKLAVKSEGRIVLVNPPEIDWLEAASNYVKLHTGTACYLVRGSISEMEAKLDRRVFLRIHRSIIVNTERIKEVRPCNSGEYVVTLRGGKELPASRTYRPNIEPLLRRTL